MESIEQLGDDIGRLTRFEASWLELTSDDPTGDPNSRAVRLTVQAPSRQGVIVCADRNSLRLVRIFIGEHGMVTHGYKEDESLSTAGTFAGPDSGWVLLGFMLGIVSEEVDLDSLEESCSARRLRRGSFADYRRAAVESSEDDPIRTWTVEFRDNPEINAAGVVNCSHGTWIRDMSDAQGELIAMDNGKIFEVLTRLARTP